MIKTITKLLEIFKNSPSWLLISLSIIIDVLFLISVLWPSSPYILPQIKPYLFVAMLTLNILTIVKLIQQHQDKKAKKPFYLIPILSQCYWSTSKQNDNSIVTQLSAAFTVKNCSQAPVSLVAARIKSFSLRRKEIIHDSIVIDYKKMQIFTTQRVSGDTVPPDQTLPMSLVILFRGRPLRIKPGKSLRVRLGILDSHGNKQTISVLFKSTFKLKEPEHKTPSEIPSLINDPIERKIVSILKSELTRYSTCGRASGGLGSIYTTIPGREINGVGFDIRQADSPKNQSISKNPEAAVIKSDNLDALVALYKNLTHEKRTQLIGHLLDRIDENKGYIGVSYFIVYALWKLGFLYEVLNKVKSALPQGDTREFGFGNVLMLINGLLYHSHPEFSDEALDQIEQFLCGLTEYTFTIPEKIGAIRVLRLQDSGKTPV